MTEKQGLRYSTKGVVLFLTIIAILAMVATSFANLFPFFKDSQWYDGYDQKFIEMVNDSLFDRTQSEDSKYFKYYIRSEKIINYPMTAKYFNTHGTVVAQRVDGTYDYFDSYEEYKANTKYNYYSKNNVDNLEEPVYGVKYFTNDKAFLKEVGPDYKFDPYTIKFKEDNVAITGEWTPILLTYDNAVDISGNNNAQIARDKLENSIQHIYSNINPNDNGISKLNFVYSVDFNSPFFIKAIEKTHFSQAHIPMFFISIMIAFAVILGFGFITRYDIAIQGGFYKGISRYPIEIVMTLAWLLFLPIMVIGETGNQETLESFKLLIRIVQFIVIFFGGIVILYFVHGFKSIYNKGLKSFIFQNSIFGRMGKGIYKRIVGYAVEFTNNFEGTSRNNIIVAYVGFILLGYIGTRWFVNYGWRNFIFMIWVVLINVITYLLKAYHNDIKAIESASSFLAKGHYDVKIDEDSTKFRTLAHNLNTVRNNLDSAVEDALKSERLKTELITNVSHDLKTPLTSIINYSELIVDEEGSIEDIKEYAKVINDKSHRLKELIEGLFDLSKLSSNNVDLHLEKIDFGQLLEQIYGEWEDKLTEKNIVTNLNRPEEPVIMELDGTQTSRILENLFSNIYKYSLENTRVYVDLYDDDGVELVIKNISKYPLNISTDELMERFTRGDASRTTEGYGLGLSIAKSLTEVQGGSFEIDIDGDLFKTTIKFN